MEVIPLTLAISLLLSLTFILLFVHEFARPRRAGADRDSLLPLEDDMPRAAVGASPAPAQRARPEAAHGHDHDHGAGDEVCASKRKDGRCCASCQRRKDRTAGGVAAAARS